ncbi:MAG: lamin tail domain-containing protein [Balneolaceae bacterium]|nr:lamin tail domain-containing protein [Balneolaceae bacterium]
MRSGAHVVESDGTVVVEVRLDVNLQEDLHVDIVLQPNLSSASSEDFATPEVLTLYFEAGLSAGSVQQAHIELRDDNEFEGPEHATLVLRNLRSGPNISIGTSAAFRLDIADNDQAGVVINEIQPATEADMDGDRRAEGTEAFVELLNTERQQVDLSGWYLTRSGGAAFHFPEGTRLASGAALVVINNTQPAGSYGGAQVLAAPDFSPEGDSDTVTLLDGSGTRIDAHRYRDQRVREGSLVRSPEGRGAFTGHLSVSQTSRSPGLRSDGTYFTASRSLDSGTWHILSSPAPAMRLADMHDVTPLQGFRGYEPMAAKNLYTRLDGESFTAPDRLDGVFEPGRGFLLYLNDDRSASGSTAVLEAPGRGNSGNLP